MHPDADFFMLLTLQIHQGARKLGTKVVFATLPTFLGVGKVLDAL
jgi:hypothetical protein